MLFRVRNRTKSSRRLKQRDLKGTAKKETWEKAREHGGTAILVHKKLWNNVKRIEAKGNRILERTPKLKKI